MTIRIIIADHYIFEAPKVCVELINLTLSKEKFLSNEQKMKIIILKIFVESYTYVRDDTVDLALSVINGSLKCDNEYKAYILYLYNFYCLDNHNNKEYKDDLDFKKFVRNDITNEYMLDVSYIEHVNLFKYILFK